MTVKRITPLKLTSDMVAEQHLYEGLGLTARPTQDVDCTGYFNDSNTAGVIVVGIDHALRTMPAAAIDMLRHKVGMYIWVDNIDGTLLPGEALGEFVTDGGMRERFYNTEGTLTVLAETFVATSAA
jgi:hypothetical protein